jgi:ABC-type uncharacterized transport system substrate-binding protein
MKRRAFLVASGALLASHGGNAQPARRARVGFILTTSPVTEMLGPKPAHAAVSGFLQGMNRLGYVEGQNLVLDRRSAEGKFERFGEIVADLLELKPDAIITVNIPLTLAAKNQTTTVPIVFYTGGGGDLVASGVVRSFARPGGNVTGFVGEAGPEILGKRLQYLRDAIPKSRRVAYVALAEEWDGPHGRSARRAAQALRIALFLAEATARDYAKALEAVERERPDAILVGSHPVHYANFRLMVGCAVRNKIPDMHAYSVPVDEGGLIAYSSTSLWPKVAEYVDRIVKGTKPSDLPVQQPTNFELVVNTKAARARGITLPQSILLRADRVIQ